MRWYLAILLMAIMIPAEAQRLIDDPAGSGFLTGEPDIDTLLNRATGLMTHDFLTAVDLADSAVQKAGRLNGDMILAYCYEQRGRVKLVGGELTLKEALRDLETAAAVYKDSNTPNATARHYLLRGYIEMKRSRLYAARDNYTLALREYAEVIDNSVSHPMKQNLYKIHINLGNIYAIIDQPDDARQRYLEGIAYVKQHVLDSASALYEIHAALGVLYNHLGQNQLAIEHIQKAISYLRKSSRNQFDFNLVNLLVDVYYQEDEFDEVKSIINSNRNMRKLANSINIYDTEYNSGPKSFEQQYQLLGHYDDPFDTYQNATEIQLKNLLNYFQYIQQTVRYEEMNQLWDAEQLESRRDLYFILAVSSVIIFGLLLYIFYYTYKIRKANISTQLITSNSQLELKLMRLGELNELLFSVKKQLQDIAGNVAAENRKVVKGIVREIDMKLNKSIWNEFVKFYDQSNDGFMNRLTEKYPNLTNTDKRLCSMLIKGLNTKEIAELTNRNFRSVEVSRWRLRKKLNLTQREISLVEFLNSI